MFIRKKQNRSGSTKGESKLTSVWPSWLTLFSVKRAGELTHTMYQLIYTLPESLKQEMTILKMNDDQKLLYEIVKKRVG